MYKEGVLGGFLFRGYTCLVSNRPLSVPKGIQVLQAGTRPDWVRGLTRELQHEYHSKAHSTPRPARIRTEPYKLYRRQSSARSSIIMSIEASYKPA